MRRYRTPHSLFVENSTSYWPESITFLISASPFLAASISDFGNIPLPDQTFLSTVLCQISSALPISGVRCQPLLFYELRDKNLDPAPARPYASPGPLVVLPCTRLPCKTCIYPFSFAARLWGAEEPSEDPTVRRISLRASPMVKEEIFRKRYVVFHVSLISRTETSLPSTSLRGR